MKPPAITPYRQAPKKVPPVKPGPLSQRAHQKETPKVVGKVAQPPKPPVKKNPPTNSNFRNFR
jgi:hypothetical protein